MLSRVHARMELRYFAIIAANRKLHGSLRVLIDKLLSSRFVFVEKYSLETDATNMQRLRDRYGGGFVPLV